MSRRRVVSGFARLAIGSPFAMMVTPVGPFVAAISAYLCIAMFLRFLERTGMAPFAVYRLALAALLVVVFGTD